MTRTKPRPKRPDCVMMTIRVTPQVRERWHAAAGACGMCFEEWARTVLQARVEEIEAGSRPAEG